PLRSARRAGVARVRARSSRGHRRPQTADQPPRTAGHRPELATRRTRRGPRRRPRHQPRTHGPHQPPPPQQVKTTPITSTTPVAPDSVHLSAAELHKHEESTSTTAGKPPENTGYTASRGRFSPRGHPLHHPVSNGRDGLLRHLGAIDPGQVRGNLTMSQ